MITYKEFLAQIENIAIIYGVLPHEGSHYGAKANTISKNHYLVSNSWTTGGASGGNCWEGKAEAFYFGDEPENLTDLDKGLEALFPAMTIFQYKKIEALIKEHTWSRNEYYGNYTCKAVYYVDLKELYEMLYQ